jgi:cobyrinic acid a,c-diamide synthase
VRAIVIAAPASGSGKTTITVGIMHALARRGLSVAPFKVGPDFIDPGYHRLASGAQSVNLDAWICPPAFALDTFRHYAANADVAVIEGVMGLFDGIDGKSDAGSTAEIARLTGAPVVLVVDAARQARSAAAVVHGFASFDPRVKVGGVIFNNVASETHVRLLREAAASLPEVPVLGCFPREPSLAIPSRHLGLITAEENPLSSAFLEALAVAVERHLDLDALLALCEVDGSRSHKEPACSAYEPCRSGVDPVRIAVARDAAFCFVYEDNLRLLAAAGAELVPFSPLKDAALPDAIAGIYLPGGYPELFGRPLAENRALKQQIREAVDAFMPVYAECGGFIYLTRGVAEGEELFPMVGVFPVSTRMLPRRKALGYREVELMADSLLGGAGVRARGHEFHYSEMDPMPDEVERVYRVSKQGMPLGTEGYRYKNCLGSYVHLHFGSSPGLAESIVGHCRKYRERSSR